MCFLIDSSCGGGVGDISQSGDGVEVVTNGVDTLIEPGFEGDFFQGGVIDWGSEDSGDVVRVVGDARSDEEVLYLPAVDFGMAVLSKFCGYVSLLGCRAMEMYSSVVESTSKCQNVIIWREKWKGR